MTAVESLELDILAGIMKRKTSPELAMRAVIGPERLMNECGAIEWKCTYA